MKYVILIIFSLQVVLLAEPLEGVTMSSADVSATFTIQALIIGLKVKEGDTVKKGDLLAMQDREIQQRELDRIKKEATAGVLIDKANLEIKFFEKDVALLVEAVEEGAASIKELNDSKLRLETAKLNKKEAEFSQLIARYRVKELESILKQYELRSPINGVIEKIFVEAGESSRVSEEHIRIVRTDPMWVEVPVPRNIALKLKRSGAAKVTFPDGSSSEEGKIIFISGVADTASDTVRVKLEFTNPEHRVVGERVAVDFKLK